MYILNFIGKHIKMQPDLSTCCWFFFKMVAPAKNHTTNIMCGLSVPSRSLRKRDSISNKLTYHLSADHVNSLENSKRQVVIRWDNSSGKKNTLLALLGSTWQTALSTHKTMNRSSAQQEHSHVQQHVSHKEGTEPALERQKSQLNVITISHSILEKKIW